MSNNNAALDFCVTFAVTFSLIFVLAVGATLVGLPWRDWFPGAEANGSLLSDVHSAVYTLMSHLQ